MSSNYDALSGGVNAWGLGGMGVVRRGGFGSGGALGTAQFPPPPGAPAGSQPLMGADSAPLLGADGAQLWGYPQ